MMYERMHKADAEFFKMVDGLEKSADGATNVL